MAVPIIMPRQGQSVESCIIAKWFKKKGETVNVGDILFSYETDKAAFDEEAKVAGTLLEIFAQEGDDVPVLTNVCVLGAPGEDISQYVKQEEAKTDKKTEASAEASKTEEITENIMTSTQYQTTDNSGMQKISPRARNLADKLSVDYRNAKGSGPYGRIIERDILELKEKGIVVTSAAKAFLGDKLIEGTGIGGRVTTNDLDNPGRIPGEAKAAAAVDGPDFEDVMLPNIRKVIAKAMFNSISTTCQLTLNSSFDATDVMEYRTRIKAAKERIDLENITLNDIIVYSVSRTLLSHKDLNAHFLEDKMRYFKNIHIGIAVDTDRGLMVPTLFNANLKSLNEISKEIKILVKECQKGTISPDYLKGASFTITNLGTLDIESFTPVLNPPQTGILGVNSIIQRAREVEDGIVYYPAMGLSLTFDHRALDGAPAAKFLKDLKLNLENFSVLLAK